MDYQSFQPGGQNQNQTPQIFEQTSQPHKFFSLKLIGLVVLVLVIVGAVWGFFSISTRCGNSWLRTRCIINDTSIWQTYHNDQYGFEFKYPDGFNVIKDGDTYKVSMPLYGWDIAHITVLTQEEYKTYLANPTKYQQPDVRAQNSNFVAAYSGPQECPDSQMCKTFTEVIGIIPQTIKFTK